MIAKNMQYAGANNIRATINVYGYKKKTGYVVVLSETQHNIGVSVTNAAEQILSNLRNRWQIIPLSVFEIYPDTTDPQFAEIIGKWDEERQIYTSVSWQPATQPEVHALTEQSTADFSRRLDHEYMVWVKGGGLCVHCNRRTPTFTDLMYKCCACCGNRRNKQ